MRDLTQDGDVESNPGPVDVANLNEMRASERLRNPNGKVPGTGSSDETRSEREIVEKQRLLRNSMEGSFSCERNTIVKCFNPDGISSG